LFEKLQQEIARKLKSEKLVFLEPKKMFLRQSAEVNLDDFIEFPIKIFEFISFDFQWTSGNLNAEETRKIFANKILYWIKFACPVLMLSLCSIDLFIKPFILQENTKQVTVLLSGIAFTFDGVFFSRDVSKKKFTKALTLLRKRYPKRQRIVRKYAKNFKLFCGSLIVFFGIFYIFMVFYPIFEYIFNGTRMFPVPLSCEIIDLKVGWNYPITLLWLDITFVIVVMQISSFATLKYGLISIVASEFRLLSLSIRNLKRHDESDVDKIIDKYILQYNQTLELAKDLNEILSVSFLARFVVSAGIIAFLVFSITTTSKMADIAFYMMYIMTELGQIFLQCFFGQLLINSNEDVSNGIYDCGWENWKSFKLKGKVAVFLKQSQKQVAMSLWKFGEISIYQFEMVKFY
jgi:hypothetical protein